MFRIGDLEINKMCLGNFEVVKAYLGEIEVYGSSGPTPPPTPTGDPVNFIPTEFDGRAVFYNDLTGEYINLGSDWSFGEDEHGAYVTNNGNSGMYSLGIVPDASMNYDIKFMYSNPDGRQFFGNSSEYDDSGNTFRFFFYDFMCFDLGVPGDFVCDRIGIENTNYLDKLNYIRISNYYLFDLISGEKIRTDVLVGNGEQKSSYPNLDYLYIGTDAESDAATFKIYGIYVSPITPKYLTITVDDEAGETIISPNVIGGNISPNLQYRVNDGDWNDFICGQSDEIHVFSGDVVQFKGINENGISISITDYLNFSISNNVHISGNVMSLIDGIGETTVIPNDYCFYYLFGESKIKTVSPDFLPATTLKTSCYYSMFYGCSNLVQAPELPATELAVSCYFHMFENCYDLVQAPELPATELASGCYYYMFQGCHNLVQAPELPATELADSCYQYMFSGCISLTQAPELPATELADSCYQYMFSGCISLTQAPELPAEKLVNRCYNSMFRDCTNLNYVKSLAREGTIGAFNAVPPSLTNWLYGVSQTGTIVKPAGISYKTNSTGGIPKNWTVVEVD